MESISLRQVPWGRELLSEKVYFSPLPSEPFTRGCVQIFTGEGRGKTSAAIGTVIRALGHGLKVCIVYFMKGSPSGERAVLSQLPGVTVASFGGPEFIDPDDVKPAQKAEGLQGLTYAREAMLSGKYNIIVLDEVNIAIKWKLIDLEEVVKLIKDKPFDVELILTGRYADVQLVQMAGDRNAEYQASLRLRNCCPERD
jgi:cob(I)alamin adenosyltransferase